MLIHSSLDYNSIGVGKRTAAIDKAKLRRELQIVVPEE